MEIVHPNPDDPLLYRRHRLRVRRLDDHHLVRLASENFLRRDGPLVVVQHGGGVVKAYGYPAETEGAVAVALSESVVIVWGARVDAHEVTLSRVVEAAIPVASRLTRPAFDKRYTSQSKIIRAFSVIIHASQQAYTAWDTTKH